MFPGLVIELISKVSPWLARLLENGVHVEGSVVGNAVGHLVSSALGGVNMQNPESVASALDKPGNVDKLKELEMQLADLQNARVIAQKETGGRVWVRPFLALLAMGALIGDIYAIQYVTDKMLNEILIMMLVFLVWDIRQIYKFYFGSSSDSPEMSITHKK